MKNLDWANKMHRYSILKNRQISIKMAFKNSKPNGLG